MGQEYAIQLAAVRTTADKRLLQQQILEMRTAGLSFGSISREMGCTQAYCYKLYIAALNAIITPEVEQLRKQEGERLDNMLVPLMTKIMEARNKAMLGVEFDSPVNETLAALAISKRRATLFGLDTPVKAKLEVSTGGTQGMLEGLNLATMSTAELVQFRDLLAKAQHAGPVEQADPDDDDGA